MKVVTSTPTPKKKTVNQIAEGQVFRYGETWYMRVYIDDGCIRNFGDFYDQHVLEGMPQARNYNTAVPCIQLESHNLCYANGEEEVDEWGIAAVVVETQR